MADVRGAGGGTSDCSRRGHFADFPLKKSTDKIFGHFFKCAKCAKRFKPSVCGSRYNTESGDLAPGDMYWATWLPENFFWDNHKGPHLCVILPNGHEWNIDSRASNCMAPGDRLHRCWIRHGDPPNVTVDKNGSTCPAGGGSIQSGDYHGHLQNGVLT